MTGARRLFLRYLSLRRELAWTVQDAPLDTLLASLEPMRAAPARTSVRVASWVIRIAEPIAARLVPRHANTCLYRALARYGALTSCGIRATFVLGLPPPDGDGHAWIEIEGRPFNERGTPRFTRVIERTWSSDDRAPSPRRRVRDGM